MSGTWRRLSWGAYPLFYSPLHHLSAPISPHCHDEFLLFRPAVHVITVVTARWSVIHFSDLCIPITKWRLLSRLYVCPCASTAQNVKKRWGARSNEGQRCSRSHYPPLHVCSLASVLVFGWVLDMLTQFLFHPMLMWRVDTVLCSWMKLCSEKKLLLLSNYVAER